MKIPIFIILVLFPHRLRIFCGGVRWVGGGVGEGGVGGGVLARGGRGVEGVTRKAFETSVYFHRKKTTTTTKYQNPHSHPLKNVLFSYGVFYS